MLVNWLALLPLLAPPDDHAAPYADRPELSFQAGLSEIFDSTRLGTFAVEYRHSPLWGDLLPIAGVVFTNQEDTLFFLGLQYNFHLNERWRLSPNTAVGYFNGGGGLDLGGELEFRSGIELSYRLRGPWRAGLHFSHSSNAGFFDINPGTETLTLGLSAHL